MNTTKTEVKHSELPWKIELRDDGYCIFPGAGGFMIVSTNGIPFCNKTDKANAAFIIRACNNHAQLLEACKKALAHCLPFQLSEFADISVIQALRHAIRGADEDNQ